MVAPNPATAWTNGSQVIQAILEFNATAVPSGNYSNAYAQFRFYRSSSDQTYCNDGDNTLTIDCNINGRVLSWQGNYTVQNGVGYGSIVASASWQIPHNTDGHQHVVITADFRCPQGAGSYIPYNYSVSLSIECDLDTIPRGSVLSTPPNFNFEDSLSIGVTKYSDSFRDDLHIYIGDTLIKNIQYYTNGQMIAFTNDEILLAYNLLGTGISYDVRFVLETVGIGYSTQYATGTAAGTSYFNNGGSWIRAIPYVNVNGAWKPCIHYTNVNGSWLRGKG